MRAIAFKRGKKTLRNSSWIKTNFGSGVCFTLSFDKLENLLHDVSSLNVDEVIERLEIGEDGITVFIGGNVQMQHKQRV